MAADLYWRSFCKSPSQWARHRYQIFSGFTSILTEKYFPPTDADLEKLRQVLNDLREGALYRVDAGLSLAILRNNARDTEDAADLYRQAIEIADSAQEKELRRRTTNERNQEVTVNELLKALRQQCGKNLAKIAPDFSNSRVNPSPPTQEMRSDGTYIERARTETTAPMSADADVVRRAVTIGGSDCDVCHKTLTELGVSRLDACSQCKMAYYCSRKCQSMAWKQGHKMACRTPTQRVPGEWMKLIGLESSPQLNGQIVKLVAERPDGRWEVKLESSTAAKMVCVATDKLVHIRPAK
jgi:hypothetical protein